VAHVICSVAVGPPFVLAGTQDPLPETVPPGDDGGPLGVWVTSSTSGNFSLAISVNAVSCSG
jgi:hypothetical protein